MVVRLITSSDIAIILTTKYLVAKFSIHVILCYYSEFLLKFHRNEIKKSAISVEEINDSNTANNGFIIVLKLLNSSLEDDKSS